MPKNSRESRRAHDVQQVVSSDATKSAKIRRLNHLGLPRADIARALAVRYQFVRNVLEHDDRRVARDSELSAVERRRVDELTANLGTKADKIRALGASGFSRSRIAHALGLRYQHVYNVLADANLAADRVAEGRTDTATAVQSPAEEPNSLDPIRIVIDSDRRVTIPQHFMDAVGITVGGEAVVCLEGDELQLYSQETAVRRVQQLVSRYVPADVSLSDELIAERRREAAREADDA